jgi:hypothetical protein
MFYSEFKYIFNLYMTICVDYLKPADINTYLNLYRVVQSLVLTVLDQSITIIFFLYRLATSDIKKTSIFHIV